MVGVYGIHFRFHGLKPILKINIRYFFQVVGRLINNNQLIILSFNEKSISYWCMMCPTRSIEFLYFLSFRFNIQCYSLNIRFYLDVNFWFLNFFKFHFPFIANFKKKSFFRKITCFETNSFFINWMVEIISSTFFWIPHKFIFI